MSLDSTNIGSYLADRHAQPHLDRAHLAAQAVRAMERLSAPQRRVLELYFLHELTLQEIAQRIGLHQSRVSQLKHEALARLRLLLERPASPLRAAA